MQNLTILGDTNSNNEPISTLRLNPCMRYGAFDTTSGERHISYNYYDNIFTNHAAYQLGPNNYNILAYPGDMIFLFYGKNIFIRNLILDGNIDSVMIGGGYTEGIQIAGYSGITINGTRDVVIHNVRAHHFGYDGITIRDSWCPEGTYTPPINLLINKSIFSYNARNNMTWAGGTGVTVNGSVFSYAGQSRFVSSPGAGLDIEYEPSFGGYGYGNSIGRFNDCRFEYNLGWSLISDIPGLKTRDFVFTRCTFVSNFYSAHIRSRQMTFDRCTFAGMVTSQYSAPYNPILSPGGSVFRTRFLNCRFSEEYDVPGLGRRSFQQTVDETDTNTCPIPTGGHLFLLNILGQATEIRNCRTWTNLTMKDAFLNTGNVINSVLQPLPKHNKIQIEDFQMFNHGLNGCDCDNVLSSLSNVNFIGNKNRQYIVGLGFLRNHPFNGCNQYLGVNNAWLNDTTASMGLPGSFDQQACCSSGGVPIVQKYANSGFNDPLRVYDLFSNDSLNPAYDTYSGLQTYCNWTQFRIRGDYPKEVNEEIKIYPNPATSTLTIENTDKGLTIKIYDLTGRAVFQWISEANTENINIRAFQPGMYFVCINGSTEKFIKQ